MNKPGALLERIENDVRYKEGIRACMNCGACTAICPAAEFYEYDPRILINIVQTQNEEKIEELLKSDFIWFCGQCMSCKTRCPRNNCPGLIVNVLRKISQETGWFTHSKKGRQQLVIKRNIGETILKYGYCIHPEIMQPERHPEQGPVWEWIFRNKREFYRRMNSHLDSYEPGTLRKITPNVISELVEIFRETGCLSFFQTIEEHSRDTAKKMGLTDQEGNMENYLEYIENE